MTKRLVLILGDQLSTDIVALREADRARDIVVMAEVMDEASYVPHHPKKIAFLFAAMRKFAAGLEADGWRVRYTRLDDPENAGSISGELLRRAEEAGATEVLATEPGEFRLIAALEDCPLPVHQFPDDRFLCSHADFDAWAEGRKELRMEWFYREMRRKIGLLMDGDKPEGGKWNYDHENRKPAPDDIGFGGPMHFDPDETVEEVLSLVEARFGGNFGTLRPFWFATDRGQARRALGHFIANALPRFGDYQDAMLDGNRFLYHSVISMYLNAGLLGWREICDAAEAAYRSGDAPLNAVEGFIRQIIGWREFMRGIYFREGPGYVRRNVLDHQRKLPDFYWTADTDMRCIARTVEQTRDEAYAHHIQRLMVTGNFALLAGIDPHEVHEWYLAVYADAYEWVEAPNVIGMSQFADGGIVGSKPYVSGGVYIHKMSDYCKKCSYDVGEKSGDKACPFNYLYWAFLHRNRDRFGKNPRMAQMYRTWARMSEEKRSGALDSAERFLERLAEGKRV
ncbi:cryptochrome/photolyase family protein [Roseibacterium sp. SDUM158016]|uniref:cryptochrome/photolyase family protein n=1 Tax=Roseicyclus sediminis TaxID=2980997 RepID=UPI0021D3A0DB|nr:cryptochrome/photolyase family protein [Roseibacterium sp. SDUM158016]MCU4655007.1 cryptochrome/photolyase family protein [Roseibacterium sp. SDUM158016]